MTQNQRKGSLQLFFNRIDTLLADHRAAKSAYYEYDFEKSEPISTEGSTTAEEAGAEL